MLTRKLIVLIVALIVLSGLTAYLVRENQQGEAKMAEQRQEETRAAEYRRQQDAKIADQDKGPKPGLTGSGKGRVIGGSVQFK